MTNTGENFRRFIEGVGIAKTDLTKTGLISRSNLYLLFNKDKVDWMEIARIHNYLKRHYTYNIEDFFPDMPNDFAQSKGIGEVAKGDRDLIGKITQDRDIWKEKYISLLEKQTQLQDMHISTLR